MGGRGDSGRKANPLGEGGGMGTAMTGRVKQMRRRVAMWVIFAVCTALGWWWWSRQPKQLVVMAEMEGYASVTFDTGFLTYHDANITGYDWDGRKLWAMRVTGTEDYYNVSPNGRFIATLGTREKIRMITCWEQGRRIWRTTFTSPTGWWSGMDGSMVFAANDGRILTTWTDTDPIHHYPTTTFYRLFDHGRCVAHGSIAHISFFYGSSTFDRLYSHGGYYTWTLKQQALAFKLHKVKLNRASITGSTWQERSQPERFLLQSDTRHPPLQLPMRVIGIASPPTMRMMVPATYCSGAVSSNGRYAVLAYEHELPPKLQWLRKQIPFLNHSSQVMAVYEQPGRVCALATWDDARSIRIHGRRLLVGDSDPRSSLVAPQGHRVVLNISKNEKEHRAYLLRW